MLGSLSEAVIIGLRELPHFVRSLRLVHRDQAHLAHCRREVVVVVVGARKLQESEALQGGKLAPAARRGPRNV
jgi:hypothetical protein